MAVENKKFPSISPVGDSAVLIELDDKISPEVNSQVHTLEKFLQENPIPGILEAVPGYSSLLVLYDPLLVSLIEIECWLQEGMHTLSIEITWSKREIVVPVHYGGDDGPDIEFVANYHHISPEEVVHRHANQVYRVGMMGFTPGFAYLMGLDPILSTPRLETPRTCVPAGSVGIAGGQTGIYPLESPGGWRIIGRTMKELYDPNEPPYFLFSPGDSVRFIPVDGEGIK